MESKAVALSSVFGMKAGMTRVFDEQGNHIPVTVIKLIPNIISQVKTQEKEGYTAYQVAFFEKKEKLLNSSTKGHLKKANIDRPFSRFSEVRLPLVENEAIGKEISLDSFPVKTYVDVTGVSKGKGFQGVMKRYNFQGGPAAHGSHFHRRVGSIGNRATPARVFPEKKMPGHMGQDKVTVQNLMVVAVNKEKGYMLIKGSIPGSKNCIVRISKAKKKS